MDDDTYTTPLAPHPTWNDVRGVVLNSCSPDFLFKKAKGFGTLPPFIVSHSMTDYSPDRWTATFTSRLSHFGSRKLSKAPCKTHSLQQLRLLTHILWKTQNTDNLYCRVGFSLFERRHVGLQLIFLHSHFLMLNRSIVASVEASFVPHALRVRHLCLTCPVFIFSIQPAIFL